MPGTTAFPAALDAFPTIDPNTHEDAPGFEHDLVHNNTNAAVAALEAKVGIDGSMDVDSLDARMAAVEAGKVDTSAIGVSVAQLVGGLVPTGQLPSYVDDVLEYANYAALPATGETGKIYITVAAGPDPANSQYRWSGSTYVRLVASPGSSDAVPEGSINLYFTAQRVRDVVLSGLSTATNAAIAATDSVLAALGKLQAQLVGKIDSTALDTDGTLAANSDSKIASQKAVKTFVSAAVAAGGGAWKLVPKPSATGRANTITLTDDPDLTIAIPSAGTYVVRGTFFVNLLSQTAGYSYQFAFSGTKTSVLSYRTNYGTTGSSSGSDNDFSFVTALFPSGNGSGNTAANLRSYVEIVLVATSAGTLSLQWAQSISNANATSVQGGSYLEWAKF